MGQDYRLTSTLQRLDASQDPLSEYDVDDAIRASKPADDPGWEASPEHVAEQFAFSFDERDACGELGEYNWFAPMTSGVAKDGTIVEYPSAKELTPKMLAYWAQRARETKNPVMRARYAGLVWEFSPKVTGKSADIMMARMRIDAVVEAANDGRHEEPLEICGQLGQVLGLAISINDPDRIKRVRDATIAHERKVGDDDKLGLWGHAWDLLFDNKKVPLTDEQRAALIKDLEDRLERVSNPSEGDPIDPWAAEAVAKRLAAHYRKEGQTQDVRRVLLKVGPAFDRMGETVAPMLAQAWHQQVEALYRRFGLNEDAAERRRKISELGPAAHDGLVQYSREMKVTKDEMDGYVNAVLEGDVMTAVGRFVAEYLPRRVETEAELDEMAASTPLLARIPRKIVDGNGRPVGVIGSLAEDRDAHVVAATAQAIGFHGMFMRCVVDEMVRRFGIDTGTVMSWLRESPAFAESSHALLERGLDAYFAGDAPVAIHLLVPQVENVIRELAELVGCEVYRPNRLGGMDLRTLDDFLRDERVVKALIPDVAEYLRVLYTDRLGINLRNRVCHGMISAEECGQGQADRVFHTVIMFALARRKAQAGPGSKETDDPETRDAP